MRTDFTPEAPHKDYQCNQYDCDGKTATTIKLDQPISVGGRMGTQFVYGAPRGHLEKCERIVDWE